jgi:hypothetical protein
MSQWTPKPSEPVKQSVQESASMMTDACTKFHDDRLTIENAAIFGPPIDRKTGHYVSDKGRRYSRSFHDSVLEAANTGALGWPYHPKATANGYEMRPADTFTHSVVPDSAWIDETGASPIVRADVVFEDAATYKRAKRGKKKLGFSLFADSAITNFDPVSGREVFESLDPDRKRPLSVDLVEASGATRDITESASEEPTTQKKEPIMADKPTVLELTPEQRASIIEEAKVAVRQEMQPQLDAGKKALDESAALRKQELVNSRLTEKKLDGKYVTESLRKSLAVCESADDMDKLIDDHKAILAKTVNPVVESGGEGVTKVEITKTSILEDVQTKGFPAVVAECAGTEKNGAKTLDKLMKFGFHKIANFRDTSKGTMELRKAISESVSLRGLAKACGGQDLLDTLESRTSVLETSNQTPLLTTGFSNINAAVLASEYILGYNIVDGLIGKQLVKKYTSRVFPETYAGFTAAGGIGDTAENAAANDSTMAERYVTDPASAPSKRTVAVYVTREEVLLDKTGQVLERANRAGNDARVDEETAILNGVFELSGVTSYRPSGSQTALFTATNTKSGNPLIDFKNIKDAATTLRSFKDENNRFLMDNNMRPYVMVVPNALYELALDIINLRMYRRVSNGGESVMEVGAEASWNGTQVLMSPYLDATSTTNWYMAGASGFQKQYILKELIPFEVVQIPQAEIQAVIKDRVAGIKAEYWHWVVARDNKYVILNAA